MNRTELVDAVGERLGDRRTAAVAVEAVLDAVTTALSDGQKVSLFGFGVFEKVERAARTARNPATGGTVEVPATAVPRFRAGQALKDAVNGRSSGAAQRRATASGAPLTRTVSRAQARQADGESVESGADGRKPSVKGADGTKADGTRSGTEKAGSKKQADGKKKADGKKGSRAKAG